MDEIKNKISACGQQLGFDKIGFANIELKQFQSKYLEQISQQDIGDMKFLQRNKDLRFKPNLLVSGTKTIITASLNYLPAKASSPEQILKSADKAYISRYALGRDYHKVFRNKLKTLATLIEKTFENLSYRVFCDCAPVMEIAIASKSALGWQGKNCLLINRNSGSWFFLGEIYTNLDLKIKDIPTSSHCGSCTACLKACPTMYLILNHRTSWHYPLKIAFFDG